VDYSEELKGILNGWKDTIESVVQTLNSAYEEESENFFLAYKSGINFALSSLKEISSTVSPELTAEKDYFLGVIGYYTAELAFNVEPKKGSELIFKSIKNLESAVNQFEERIAITPEEELDNQSDSEHSPMVYLMTSKIQLFASYNLAIIQDTSTFKWMRTVKKVKALALSILDVDSPDSDFDLLALCNLISACKRLKEDDEADMYLDKLTELDINPGEIPEWISPYYHDALSLYD